MSSPQLPKPLSKEENNRISNHHAVQDARESDQGSISSRNRPVSNSSSRINEPNITPRDNQRPHRVPPPPKQTPNRISSLGSNLPADQGHRNVNENNQHGTNQPKVPQRTLLPPPHDSAKTGSRIPRPRPAPIPNPNIPHDSSLSGNRSARPAKPPPPVLRGPPIPPRNRPVNRVKIDSEKERPPSASVGSCLNTAVSPSEPSISFHINVNEFTSSTRQNDYAEVLDLIPVPPTNENNKSVIDEPEKPGQISCTPNNSEAQTFKQPRLSVPHPDDSKNMNSSNRFSVQSSNFLPAGNHENELPRPSTEHANLLDITSNQREYCEKPIKSYRSQFPDQTIVCRESSEDIGTVFDLHNISQDDITTVGKSADFIPSKRKGSLKTGILKRNAGHRSTFQVLNNCSGSDTSPKQKKESKKNSIFSKSAKSSKKDSRKAGLSTPKVEKKSKKSKDKNNQEKNNGLQTTEKVPLIYDDSFTKRFKWPSGVLPLPPAFQNQFNSHKCKYVKRKNKS